MAILPEAPIMRPVLAVKIMTAPTHGMVMLGRTQDQHDAAVKAGGGRMFFVPFTDGTQKILDWKRAEPSEHYQYVRI